MKLRSLLLLMAFCLTGALNAQVFYNEGFDGTPCATGSGCDPSIIGWTVNSQGGEGANANRWYVSDRESGVLPPGCGVGGTGNQSLHIGNVSTSAAAFLFCPAGDCGAAYDDSGPGEITNSRVESPVINCTGQSNITADFNFIEAGQTTLDDCTFWYFDGAVWASIDPMAKTPGGCAPQGQWTSVVTVALPASADNNPNVQIGFLWVNNGDGVAADPSVAIDEVTLTNNGVPSGPTANFSASDSTICVGDCISFTDLSTGGPIVGWGWQFTGADSLNSTTQNPTNICYSAPGTYDVALVVFDGAILDTLIMPNFITVNPLPIVTANAAPSTTVCTGDMVTLTGGGANSYSWTGGVTDNVAFPAGATTNYIVTGTDNNGCTDTSSVTITVNNCSVPTASFTADSITICVGGDILFTDNSTGTAIANWVWDFDVTGIGGAAPATANAQGPHNVVFNTVGTYSVNLSVTDANGTDDTTIVVNVVTCSSLNAGFTTSSSTICAGDSVIFTDATTGGTPTVWQWDFDLTAQGGVAPGTAIGQGAHTVFFNNPGTYTVELIVSDGTSLDTTTTTITVNDCSPTANFSASNTTLCETDCITFTDLSTGNPTSYSWTFPGGTPATATGANPGSVCYATSGAYNVTLTVTNQYGTDSIAMINLITVNICTAPTAGITMSDANGEICVNNCIDFTYDAGAGGTPTTINWTFPGGTPSSYNSTDPTEVINVCWNDTIGNFNITLTAANANGTSNVNITIIVHDSPMVNAGLDTSITIGTDAYLNALVTDTAGNTISTTGGTYSWTPTSNLGTPNDQSTTVIQPLESGVYTVTYTDSNGCVVTDDVFITVDIALNIGVPSAFSPNGDGSNDFLWLRGKIVVQTMNFTIFNRYGQKVFETTDVDEGWDGTHNGKEVNPGVFVYYVNVTFIDGSTGQLKGNVTLVR